MSLFRVNKPRGFHHNYIYYDPHKEKQKEREERVRRELGLLPPKEFSPEDIRGRFVDATTHLKRRKEHGQRFSSGALVFIVVILILIMGVLYGC